jgi:hypothetical protein
VFGSALWLVWRLTAVLLFPSHDVRRAAIYQEEHRHLQNIGRHPWVYGNERASYFELHVPDRREILRLLSRTVQSIARYRRDRDAAASLWRSQLGSFTTVASWCKYFETARTPKAACLDRNRARVERVR